MERLRVAVSYQYAHRVRLERKVQQSEEEVALGGVRQVQGV